MAHGIGWPDIDIHAESSLIEIVNNVRCRIRIMLYPRRNRACQSKGIFRNDRLESVTRAATETLRSANTPEDGSLTHATEPILE